MKFNTPFEFHNRSSMLILTKGESMLKIDPERLTVLRRVAIAKRETASALMQAAAGEMHSCDVIRKEILAETRRSEKSGAGGDELEAIKLRRDAAQIRVAETVQQSEIAQDEYRSARKLVNRCETFLRELHGGDHAV